MSGPRKDGTVALDERPELEGVDGHVLLTLDEAARRTSVPRHTIKLWTGKRLRAYSETGHRVRAEDVKALAAEWRARTNETERT